MELQDLIKRGYFPKELPPPFNTEKLAEKIADIDSSWQSSWQDVLDSKTDKKAKKALKKIYGTSKTIIFSISKGKYSRRFLGIPNPLHFFKLSKDVVQDWDKIKQHFTISQYSKSFPVLEEDEQKRCVSTFSKNLSDFRDQYLETSFGKFLEIFVDISKFYPTIYTHSITWAFVGKLKAKKYFKDNSSLDSDTQARESYNLANKIDTLIRNCQDGQSIGIPIGTDTSHIIAEIIACRIDKMLQEQCQEDHIDLKACRYYDDYYLFVNSQDEADRVLKKLQNILLDFQLEINEGKFSIKEFPFSFEDNFVLILSQFKFFQEIVNNNIEGNDINEENNTEDEREIYRDMKSSIKHYFSVIWELADKTPSKADWIFRYALKRFEKRTTKIIQQNWELFETLLLQTALLEPSILDIVTRILLSYQRFFHEKSKEKLKILIEHIIKNHSLLKHSFEVSWSLWIVKTFQIQISIDTANYVIEMKDSISLLILLDIVNTTSLIQDELDFSSIENELNPEALFSENWLIVYEGAKKGWLTPNNPNFIDDNIFFKILKDRDIEFYDSSKQLQQYLPINPNYEQEDDEFSYS